MQLLEQGLGRRFDALDTPQKFSSGCFGRAPINSTATRLGIFCGSQTQPFARCAPWLAGDFLGCCLAIKFRQLPLTPQTTLFIPKICSLRVHACLLRFGLGLLYNNVDSSLESNKHLRPRITQLASCIPIWRHTEVRPPLESLVVVRFVFQN